jgi:hypothetical protein
MALRMGDVSAELEMVVKTKLESEKGSEGQRGGIGTQHTAMVDALKPKPRSPLHKGHNSHHAVSTQLT